MRILDSCPVNNSSNLRACSMRGFTLLEMLVVLALVSIVVALVVPRLSQVVEAISRSGERAEVVRQLESMPMMARRQGQMISLGERSSMDHLLDLPSGWSVTCMTPLEIKANGICDRAEIQVSVDGLLEIWHMHAPDCAVNDAH